MKHYRAALLVLCVLFSSCAGKKDGEIAPMRDKAMPITLPVEDAAAIPQPFSRRSPGGEYWEVNDLSDFLTYLDDPSIQILGFYRGTFSDLSPLSDLSELKELSIDFNRNVTNISPLASLVNLKKLILFETGMKNIEPISSLVNLRHLEIRDWELKERYFREFLPLQQLEILVLLTGTLLDAAYISQLHSLKELNITPRWEGDIEADIVSIELLGNLSNLERLTIWAVPNLDISWIADLQNLEYLELRGCMINDISPLLTLPHLVEVNLIASTVGDFTPLLESKSIKSITGFYGENFSDELIVQFRERGIEFQPSISDR